ncbi:Homocysteine S-methyltransferase [Rhodobacteraceae bacterium THAF1]|uniref:homocysteine S-methyltransferase family protein n=1 Tax=Palleronia sp. THAF1 TaxID=2587842 RepID=UPI000F3EBCF7|nr:homocysteine S-methyltransferase family protein [Palleronia sp. THAF1]QFU07962.1 Homocysteine S-methyltransferase [Palleronia sp. THAF1]VDC27813.1 Homocysteine S-methyltransferase [Rhodobacteraceae bacterium THAF1]
MSITILDGGMGQELVRRAGRATPLWSTQALLDAPEIVRAVHDDFFAAGADIATTDTYSVLPSRLEPQGLEDRLEDLARVACEVAVASRDAHGSGLVAGGLGPLGFSYRPDLAPPPDEAAETYARLARLHAPYVDLHLAETMGSVDEARGALMGMGVTGKPVWVALTLMDDDGTRLRSGEPLADIAPLLQEFKPQAVLLNCSWPEAIGDGLKVLAPLGVPCGAYANGFTRIAEGFDRVGATVDLLEARRDLDPVAYAEHAQAWRDTGATIIGGCCEIGPDHIAELSRRFA